MSEVDRSTLVFSAGAALLIASMALGSAPLLWTALLLMGLGVVFWAEMP